LLIMVYPLFAIAKIADKNVEEMNRKDADGGDDK